jgi:hypothetical protein
VPISENGNAIGMYQELHKRRSTLEANRGWEILTSFMCGCFSCGFVFAGARVLTAMRSPRPAEYPTLSTERERAEKTTSSASSYQHLREAGETDAGSLKRELVAGVVAE